MALTQTYEGKSTFSFSNILKGFTRLFDHLATASWRVEEVERLSALSDDALAAKGIKREDIVRHVFRDVMWQ